MIVFSSRNISISFLHPIVGFFLAKSKNLTFSSRERIFCASLPASCWFDSVMFANLMLENSFSEAIFFQTWTFEIMSESTLYRNQPNHSQTSQCIHKSSTNQQKYPQTSHNHPVMSRKSVFHITKNSSNDGKHVQSLQPLCHCINNI